jgi:hypothetical protein
MPHSLRSRQEYTLLLLTMSLLVLIYVWVYLYAPLGGMSDEIVLNLIYLFFVIYPLIILWRILDFYDQQDNPRRIWLDFLFGFGLFFVGEALWAITNVTAGEVPSPSMADAFFVFGYFFLVTGLVRQYNLVFPARKQNLAVATVLLWLAGIGLSFGFIYLFTGAWGLDGFFEYLYVALDLLLALLAFYLMRTFGNSLLARPLWGFVALFVADLIYGLLVTSDTYAYVLQHSDFTRLFSDMAYNLAYIIFAVAFWGHYAVLKYDAEDAAIEK